MTAKEIDEKLNDNELTYEDLSVMAEDVRQRYKEKFGEDVPTIGVWGFVGKYIETVDKAIETGIPLEEAPKTINGLEVKY